MRAKHWLSSWRATVGAVLIVLYIEDTSRLVFPSPNHLSVPLDLLSSTTRRSTVFNFFRAPSTMPKALAPRPVFDRTGSESWTHVDIYEFLRPAMWALASFMLNPNWRRDQELTLLALNGQALSMVSFSFHSYPVKFF